MRKLQGAMTAEAENETSAENDKTPHTFLHSESLSAAERERGGCPTPNVLQRMEWLTPFREEEQEGSYRLTEPVKALQGKLSINFTCLSV